MEAYKALADDYARMTVTPLYRGGETPTPYERGMLQQIRQAFLAGAAASSSGQDNSFSSCGPEFDSPRCYQPYPPQTGEPRSGVRGDPIDGTGTDEVHATEPHRPEGRGPLRSPVPRLVAVEDLQDVSDTGTSSRTYRSARGLPEAGHRRGREVILIELPPHVGIARQARTRHIGKTRTICAISDLHGTLPDIPPCDLLVIAGDICPEVNQYEQIHWLNRDFRPWLKEQPVKYGTVATLGNHDTCGNVPYMIKELHLRWHLLIDQRVVLGGIKIYGTPWQPRFAGVFNLIEPDLETKWSRIPDDTQLLIVHGPPYGYGDKAYGGHKGSRSLTRRIHQIRPALVAFGHIHEGRGVYETEGSTLVNCSLMDGNFLQTHQPWVGDVDFTPLAIRDLAEVY